MRLLLVNSSSRRIAGTEIYLEDLLRELARRDIPAAILAANAEPRERAPIATPPGNPVFHDFAEAAAWGPTVVMGNGRIRADWETELQRRWPSAYFIHNYYGTCISGLKRHQHPAPEPCFRRLGPACLALYLPRGCGGKNPATMFRLYSQEQAQQERLRGYGLLVTHSEAMREEYQRHSFSSERIAVIPFACVPEEEPPPVVEGDWDSGPWKILFAGRMEAIKGGAELIRASAVLAQSHPVQLTMAGEGERRPAWEALAQELRVEADFPGWLSGAQLEQAYRTHHVFAMPSLWPEPFGKGGMEAARHGCPSVGFRLGGIPQWLADGVSGHLAEWQGDAVANLAGALAKVFAAPEHYRSLREGARRQARGFTAKVHADALLPLLEALEARGKR